MIRWLGGWMEETFHQQQHWRDYDPIALAVLFLCIGMVALAIGVP